MLFAAGCLAILLGITHSILGEVLMFKSLRENSIIPNLTGDKFNLRQIRILWVSWHLVTIFGWALGILLFFLTDVNAAPATLLTQLKQVIAVAMCGGAILVLLGTKAKHPGWIVLLSIASLVWFT